MQKCSTSYFVWFLKTPAGSLVDVAQMISRQVDGKAGIRTQASARFLTILLL